MIEQSVLNDVLLGILWKGVLQMRAQSFAGLANQCAVEADHLHNLPLLILKQTLQEISYHFDVTRIGFINSAGDTREFDSDWERQTRILSDMRRISN